MSFSILVGLAMDYDIFLMCRVSRSDNCLYLTVQHVYAYEYFLSSDFR